MDIRTAEGSEPFPWRPVHNLSIHAFVLPEGRDELTNGPGHSILVV